VRRKQPAVFGHGLAEQHQVVGRRQRARRHGEHRREPDRPILHCLLDELLHLLKLRRARPLVRAAHHAPPDIVDAHVGHDVDADAGPLQRGKVFAQRAPAHRLPADKHLLRLQLADPRAGRRAFAQHLGRHPLANLALGQTVLEQDVVGVRVHVDEAGRDDQPGGIDLLGRLARRHAAHGDDLTARHGHIAGKPRIAAAIDDVAVFD
jgi:hypothetical protein